MLSSTLPIQVVTLALALIRHASAKLYESARELDLNERYDFIIVGSGPGGSTVAARMSENPKYKVLLIEAGANDDGVATIHAPLLQQTIPSTYMWNYTTEATPATSNRSLNYLRGYVLGGSSSVNGMVYSRCAADDYNGWAVATGDNGWRWDNVLPYIKKSERLVPATSGRNYSGEYDPSLHGYKGELATSLAAFGPTDFDQRALNSTTGPHGEFPFHQDMNDGRSVGLTWMQFAIGGGERSSAATSFLTGAVRARPNLSIVLNTYVTRVLQTEGGSPNSPSVRTVELGDRSARSVIGTVTAGKEVILAAGNVNTPQILLNSGIGDKKVLTQLGIKTTVNLPDVGNNMADHPGVIATWISQTNEGPAFDPEAAFSEWTANKTGPLTGTINRLTLWSRIPSNATIWKTFQDPSSGKDTPHFEMVMAAYNGTAGAFLILLNPTSRGGISLRSSNPFDAPVIDSGILKTPYDILALAEGIRSMKRFFSGPAWTNYLRTPTFVDPDTASAAEWEAYIRENVATNYHGVGTAAMSKKDAKHGVVDPDLRVKGVSGLRIVDASVIPNVPAGHTQVPIYVVAERASDLIKASWE
ncbi:hypothetical protein DFP72DRAFT_818928 [Ephemerocybe angulata]|uniref:pyranose dehydrogenase (acceptor) n=1 Tax=Ephemerocybe angulata TaxID=980116 RepID=A0A8H6LZ21_9AGAR|nr:hypothetical protein DFP72DRAFT_818928 [Tulosesus angulatus]